MGDWQRAFVLHRRAYSESSLILDLFTETAGRLSMLAKGARAQRSRLRNGSQLFTPLMVRWGSKRSGLKNLYNAEPLTLHVPLEGHMLYSAFYVNELLVRLLPPETSTTELFLAYLRCLQALAISEESPEPALRQFELTLLKTLGYGVDFLHCAGSEQPICAAMRYRYQVAQGFISSTDNTYDTFTGQQLHALAHCSFPDADTLRAAKRFTRLALQPHLGSKPLKSREFFRPISPALLLT